MAASTASSSSPHRALHVFRPAAASRRSRAGCHRQQDPKNPRRAGQPGPDCRTTHRRSAGAGHCHDRIEDLTQALSQVDAPDPVTMRATPNSQPTPARRPLCTDGRARCCLKWATPVSAGASDWTGSFATCASSSSGRGWISLDDRHFRDALSASLETIGAEGLQPVDPAHAASDPPARWLAASSCTSGAVPIRRGRRPLTRCARRAKRPKSCRVATRRADSPVVFRDPGNLNGDVVHLHLEHRVVQRLLGRFCRRAFATMICAVPVCCVRSRPCPMWCCSVGCLCLGTAAPPA